MFDQLILGHYTSLFGEEAGQGAAAPGADCGRRCLMSKVCTCSLVEALYLLGRFNRVVKVRTECTWPYGFEECVIVFEGETAEADHQLYIAGRIDVDFRELPKLFAAITVSIEKGGES